MVVVVALTMVHFILVEAVMALFASSGVLTDHSRQLAQGISNELVH
jgi:hypothetical protein